MFVTSDYFLDRNWFSFEEERETQNKYFTCLNVFKESEATCTKLYYPKVFNEDQRILELVKKDLKESR
jgi:hypothetical protein